jgi:hypothetical protein
MLPVPTPEYQQRCPRAVVERTAKLAAGLRLVSDDVVVRLVLPCVFRDLVVKGFRLGFFHQSDVTLM